MHSNATELYTRYIFCAFPTLLGRSELGIRIARDNSEN